MTDPRKTIECPCGTVVEGDGDDDVVDKALRHATEIHDMQLSREQALAMARPA